MIFNRPFKLFSKKRSIILLQSNRSVFNNYTIDDIEDRLESTKNYTYKQKLEYFTAEGLDVDEIEHFYPIVKHLNNSYYNSHYYNFNKFKDVLLFVFYFIFC
jgi:hypothetical protein